MKDKLLWGGRPLVAAALVVNVAPAQPLPVVNPSFEDITGAIVFNEFSFGPFPGWELYDDPPGTAGNGASEPFYVGTLQPQPDPANPGDFINFPAGAPDGDRVAIAYNRADSGDQGEYGLVQTLVGVPLVANRTYTLEVDVGNIASGLAISGEFFTLDGFPGYRIDLLAGGEVIASDDNSLAGAIPDGEFANATVSLTTGDDHVLLGEDLGIRLVNLNQIDPDYPESDLEVDFDNVRLVSAPALIGDYNSDGDVDAADYTVWRDTLGSQQELSADGDNDGQVTAGDYLVWRQNYGQTVLSGGGPAPATQQARAPVPEPAAATLLAIAIAVAATCRLSYCFSE